MKKRKIKKLENGEICKALMRPPAPLIDSLVKRKDSLIRCLFVFLIVSDIAVQTLLMTMIENVALLRIRAPLDY